jgi:caa(3)-type oxidase, subunit IV
MEHNENNSQHSHGYGIYILVWLGLMILTGVTITVAGINFGNLTITTALVIASVKSFLVLHIFMHLKVEQKVFRVFAAVAGIFLLISLILLFSDYSFL